MFAIRLLPPDQLGADGEWLGEILFGDLRESFACQLASAVPDLEAGWRAELAALNHGEPVAVLRYDPRFAWIVYREGNECLVQQRISLDGAFEDLLPRVDTTEEGDPISTWVTSLAAVRRFLDAEHVYGPESQWDEPST